jgi:hypothetical protein
MIIMNVYERTAGDTMPICTAYSIAKGIGLAPSNHVRKIINELVEGGWLNQREQTDLFGRKTILHWLTTDAENLLNEAQDNNIIDWKTVKGWFE